MAETDRELLELAAKAAGHEWRWHCVPFGRLLQIKVRDLWVFWSPLTDDGDALRLAVKLEIQSGYSEFSGSGFASWDRGFHSVTEYGPDDPYAATRRAIVRAAAEIGRQHG